MKGERVMAYPLVDGNIGDYCTLNGQKVLFTSEEGKKLFLPTDEITYYESVRFQKGVLLFWEDHMARLSKSVAAKPVSEFRCCSFSSRQFRKKHI